MSTLSLLSNKFRPKVTTDFDIDNGTAELTIVHHGCTLYLYVVLILSYDIQYLVGCNSINTTICDNNNRVNSNLDHDLVYYGVVYASVYAYYVVQLLVYNIQRSIGGDNINTTYCDNSTAEFTIFYHWCVLYLYVIPIIHYDMKYLIGCNNINTTNCDNNNFIIDIVCDISRVE